MFTSIEDRAVIAQDVFNKSKKYFETFGNEFVDQMIYLLGAILNDDFLELDCSFKKHSEFSKQLQSCFSPNHLVWNYIQLEF